MTPEEDIPEVPKPLDEEKAITVSNGSGELAATAKQVQDRLTQNLMDFQDPLAVAEALGLMDFNVREEVEMLVEIARLGDPKTRLSALKALRSLTQEVMKNSGMITETRMRGRMVDDSGNVIEGERTIRSITSDSMHLLESAMLGHQRKGTNSGKEVKHQTGQPPNRLNPYIKQPEDPKAPRGLCPSEGEPGCGPGGCGPDVGGRPDSAGEGDSNRPNS